MRKKVTALSVLAAGIVLAAGGTATAHDNDTHVTGGKGISEGPVVVNGPQQGLAVANGALVDARCLAPWSDGAALDGVVMAPHSRYAACDTGTVDESHNAPTVGGLLF
ncbi:hypothetical protein AQJ66_19205 [Streptomyces bungoensis]|uniref:Chaplin domain-containing protein n=1 Tax=Streptomyces bungoensis TaxID=285568 RepID=A0A101T0I3_9ACTN|nr:hypothetical protein [Streptomyces bungoensis]KUN83363.1 hypothetical protein AQJ66_19205 [Streptomyces bungoensis]